MVRIAISQAAFEAIAATLPSGNVLYERERTPHGGYFVWLERAAVLEVCPDCGSPALGCPE
jgi:hypothetical protein